MDEILLAEVARSARALAESVERLVQEQHDAEVENVVVAYIRDSLSSTRRREFKRQIQALWPGVSGPDELQRRYIEPLVKNVLRGLGRPASLGEIKEAVRGLGRFTEAQLALQQNHVREVSLVDYLVEWALSAGKKAGWSAGNGYGVWWWSTP